MYDVDTYENLPNYISIKGGCNGFELAQMGIGDCLMPAIYHLKPGKLSLL